MESPDFPTALSMFAQSQDVFDRWFKQRLAYATDLDLNTPPEAPLPELLSSHRPTASTDARAEARPFPNHAGGSDDRNTGDAAPNSADRPGQAPARGRPQTGSPAEPGHATKETPMHSVILYYVVQ